MSEDKVEKSDPAGAINSARDMVGQLQEQAKNGQIDGAILDQLEAILNVSVDSASDKQSSMKSDTSSVASTSSAPSSTSIPSSISNGDGSSDVSSSDKSSSESSSKGSSGASSSAVPSHSEDSSKDSTMETSDVHKVDEPVSARPPTPTLMFDHVEDYQAKLGDFVTAMENGQMSKAQKIAGGTSVGFDTMFSMAQHALLEEGGWNSGNLTKLNGMAANDTADLKKGLTASSVPGIYLIRLAKLMLPVYAGLTNRLPTDSPKTGSNQAIWKAQLGFGALAEAGFFRIAEANIGVNPPTNFLTFTAPYIDTTVNDNVTLKALRASAGYADPLQIAVIKAMSALLRGQERVILGGNAAAIAAPGTVSVSGSTGGGSLAAGSYVAGITALTYEGWLAASAGGSATVGESTASYAASTVTTGATSALTLTWAAVPGAVAYNVYMAATGAAGSTATWNKTVLINTAVVTGASGSTALVAPLADTTVNATYGMEGLIPWCEKATILSNAIPSKQTIYDNAGAGMTAGNGGITQFDSVLSGLWVNWHTAPSVMIMSPNMNAALVGKLQSLGAGTFYRVDVSNERNTVNGGMMVTGYVNKFAPFADGTPRMIDVIPHPYMPDGTILFLSETIPYPMGNETRGFVRDILLPYTYFPLPSQAAGVNQITYNFAVTTSQTLECFNPGPQAAVVGIDYTK
jgi:hypothetical protein